MRFRSWLVSILAVATTPVFSQYIKIGNGYISGTIAGPLSASTSRDTQFSKFAYIFPKSVLGNLSHGDTITSIEIFRVGGGILDSNCSMVVYMGNTSRSDFGTGKISFSSEISKAQKVAAVSPSKTFQSMEKFYPILFSNSFKYDSLLGENIALFVEYRQWKKQPTTLSFYIETPNSIVGYTNNQTKYLVSATLQDSLTSSTSYHPTIVFNFPKFKQDIAILKTYSLGKIPLPLGKPDSVQTLIKNVGKSALTNYWVRTYSIGKNKQRDSFKINLGMGEEGFFRVPSLNPKLQGQDTVYVESSDINISNNSAWSVRVGNPNVYSYRDVTISPAPGGIGFNGSTGDFVAKFYSASNKFLNQVTVVFGGSGAPFRIGIWEQNKSSGLPGKLVYQSDSLISKAGNYILDFKNPITVNGTFYVGVRQLNNNNVAFGYQMEEPVRPNAFFYAAPLGDTNWVDFHPDAPYKFLIEPRLQADYDFACISGDFPKDTINRYTTDTLSPKVTFANVGVFKPNDSALFTCEIFAPNGRVYKEIIKDTIRSGGRRTYTFPKKFYPLSLGEHKMVAYCSHSRDSITDNDTQIVKFYVGVKQDVGVTTVYDPINNTQYEYKTDTLMPVATISNIGYDNVPTFVARCVIYNHKKLVYNESQSLALPKFQSKILFWKTYKFQDTGFHTALFITEYTKDAFRKNDTIIRNLYVYKLLDVGIDSISSPESKTFYAVNKSIVPRYYFFNDGAIKAYDVPIYCKIFDPTGSLVFNDSIKYDMEAYDGLMIPWGMSFTPRKKGIYKIVFRCFDNLDKFKQNDSIVKKFTVGYPYDVENIAILNPIKDKIYTAGYGSFQPKVLLKNQGFIRSNGPLIIEITHNNQTIHSDVLNITLDTGKADSFSFGKLFRPLKVGNYQARVYCNTVDENNRVNDTSYTRFSATIGKDALPLNVKLYPNYMPFNFGDTLKSIRIDVENQGKDTIKNAVFNVRIYRKGLEVYNQYKSTSISGSSIDSFTLSADLELDFEGDYIIRVTSSSLDDQNPYNDTLIQTFPVITKQDLSLIMFKNPSASDLPDSTTTWNPSVIITNSGLTDSTRKTAIAYSVRSTTKNTTHFLDTNIISSVEAGDTIEVRFKSYKTTIPDAYLLEAYVLNPVDKVSKNDTLRMPYILEKNQTLASAKIHGITVTPNPANNRISINTVHYEKYRITLTDVSGKLIYKSDELSSSYLITEKYSNGIYFIIVETRDGVFSQKILIEH